MRRIAIGAIAVLLALPGVAQAFKTSSLQIHNQTRHELVAGISTADGRNHRTVEPNTYRNFSEVLNGSCVRVHLEGKTADEHCRPTGTPVDLACDLPPPYECRIHEGRVKDLLISVVQGRG